MTQPPPFPPSEAHGRTGTNPLTRRSVVGAAAWSLPALTLATAAPAFAVSSPGATDFQFVPGATEVRRTYENEEHFHDLYLVNAAIQVVGATAPVAVTLTATFAPHADAPDQRTWFWWQATPMPGWGGQPPQNAYPSAIQHTTAPIATGGSVPLNGWLMGTEVNNSLGRFVLTFSAPGLTSLTVSYATPHVPGQIGVPPA